MPGTIPHSIKQEIEKLVTDLNYHCYRYYVLDSPVISDGEYDVLYHRLKELEDSYHYIVPDSPTQRVGAPPLDKFEKVKHSEPMLSLDNAFSYEDAADFEKRIKRFLGSDDVIAYTVEPKINQHQIHIASADKLKQAGQNSPACTHSHKAPDKYDPIRRAEEYPVLRR